MECESCGNEHNGDYGSGRFCSELCARSYSTKSVDWTSKRKVVNCVDCGVELEVDIRASDKTCKCKKCNKKRIKETRRNRRRIEKEKNPPKEKKKRFCLNCKEEIKGKKYCNNQCKSEFIWKERKRMIFETNGTGEKEPSRLKRFLLEERGHKCEICGIEEWRGQLAPLIMDHINGRAADNRLENLRLVCGNCDMQLPTYKSKNKNSDRKKRVLKYL